MNTNLKHFLTAAWLFGTCIRFFAQGIIVPNGVTYVGGSFLGGYEVRVLQHPTSGDYTGFFFGPQGKTQPTSYTNTFSFFTYTDESVRVFLVSPNQPISLEPILGQNYLEFTFPNSYVIQNGVPFYVGLYTGYMPFDPQTGAYTGIYANPMFGWAQLVNNRGVIELLDSALAYNAQGIFAGTQNFVPEPGVIGLAALGVALFGFRRWKCLVSRKPKSVG